MQPTSPHLSIEGAEVRAVTQTEVGYRIETSQGPYHGASTCFGERRLQLCRVFPLVLTVCPSGVHSITPHDYKRPSDLPEGGVLVVGGSATGVQLAMELQGIWPASDPLGRRAYSHASHLSWPATSNGGWMRWAFSTSVLTKSMT